MLGLDPQRVFAATGMQAQYEAIRCGLGIGMLARYLVQPESPLVRVLPAEMWIERVLWLAAPADMFARRRVRVVWDFLRGVVAAEPRAQGVREQPQGEVTGLMAKRVVHPLEVVHVAEDQRKRRVRLGGLDREPSTERAPVQNAGERVVRGLVAQLQRLVR